MHWLDCLQVAVALWGSQAEEFDGSLQPVVAVKNGRINEYGGGKSVTLLQSSVFQVNPDITEAHKLRGWFDNIGSTQEQESISIRTGAAGGEFFKLYLVLSIFSISFA
jgi:replication factor A1